MSEYLICRQQRKDSGNVMQLIKERQMVDFLLFQFNQMTNYRFNLMDF